MLLYSREAWTVSEQLENQMVVYMIIVNNSFNFMNIKMKYGGSLQARNEKRVEGRNENVDQIFWQH